jgi:hypothetical protein
MSVTGREGSDCCRQNRNQRKGNPQSLGMPGMSGQRARARFVPVSPHAGAKTAKKCFALRALFARGVKDADRAREQAPEGARWNVTPQRKRHA